MTNAEEKAIENGKSMAFPLREIQAGLTKREYFAGLAMQGILSTISRENEPPFERIAELSVKAADELLKALDK